MSKKASPRLIGIFVVVAVALAVVGVIVFGSGRFFHERYKFVVFFDGSVAGLTTGSPVKFKGVEVGTVTEVVFGLRGVQRPADDFRIITIIELDETRIVARGGEVDLGNRAVVDTLIQQGFRAQLATESLVTGRKYVALDVFPGSPLNLVDEPEIPYPEIPTLRTGFEEIQGEIEGLLSGLGELQLDSLILSITRTVDGLSTLVNSPQVQALGDSLLVTIENFNQTMTSFRHLATEADTTLVPLRGSLRATSDQAAQTLEQAEATLAGVQAVIEPGSPFVQQFETALADLAAAGHALRRLAEYLEQNPSALVRGKPAPEESK